MPSNELKYTISERKEPIGSDLPSRCVIFSLIDVMPKGIEILETQAKTPE